MPPFAPSPARSEAAWISRPAPAEEAGVPIRKIEKAINTIARREVFCDLPGIPDLIPASPSRTSLFVPLLGGAKMAPGT
jgi:hypothetical protein